MRGCLILLVLSALAAAQSRPSCIDSGPMLGHVTETEAHLWLRLVKPGSVRIGWLADGAPEVERRWTEDVGAGPATDNCAHVVLTDLPFGRRFTYCIVVDDAAVEVDRPLAVRTQAHWRFRTDPPELLVAIGSCAYVNDPDFDRPGKPYGGDPRIFERIADRRPDAMIWLGDNCYMREPDWSSESGLRSRWRKNRRTPELQRLLSTTANYAIWDDHDFGPNDSDRSYALREASRRTFDLYWANPGRGEEDRQGIRSRFTWSDVDFFLLDDRYLRSPNDAPDRPSKVMFGDEQIEWLLDGLGSSTATFKVIAGGNQMLNPLCFYEGMARYADERRRLLDGLVERRVTGVVFLSGDRHHAELIRIERDGTYALHDFTSSPLTSGLGNAAKELDNPARVPGTLVTTQRNFGLLQVSGPREDRKLKLTAVGADGKDIWSRELGERELR